MASEIRQGSPGWGEICGNPKCRHADHRHRNGRCEVISAGENHEQCECTELISPIMQMVDELSWHERCLLARVNYFLGHLDRVAWSESCTLTGGFLGLNIIVNAGSESIPWVDWVPQNLPKYSSPWLQAHLVARSKIPGNEALALGLIKARI